VLLGKRGKNQKGVVKVAVAKRGKWGIYVILNSLAKKKKGNAGGKRGMDQNNGSSKEACWAEAGGLTEIRRTNEPNADVS